ncbi:hypothetical protein GCM10025770_19640 [Viridibacterium curvum]|uniref:DUF1444 family protein n=2 Tax=Viridibacterium curvum TaxID=1101404 RepID=A0ABP9QNN4_9RHOO
MFGLEKLFNRKPTLADLAGELLKRLAILKADEQFVFEPEQTQLRGSQSTRINLANVYMDYCAADRKQRPAILDGFLAAFTGPREPDSFAEAREQLLPVLRHLGGLDSLPVKSGERTGSARDALCASFAMKPFSPDLAIGVAFDTEQAVMQIGEKTLEKWQVGLEEALQVAIDNLRHKAAPSFTELSAGLYLSEYGDYYDAARILLTELAWQLPLNGRPVAMVPNRICLLLAGDQDEDALAAMIATSAQVLREQSRPLGAEMFRLEDQGWTVWQPPGALRQELSDLQIQNRAGDYDMQQKMLQQDAAERGEDIYVASVSLLRKAENGPILSFSVLTEGVPTWLPQTDLVILNRGEDVPHIEVPWEHFVAVAGALLEPLPYVLPRFRVTGFPDAAMLSRFTAS